MSQTGLMYPMFEHLLGNPLAKEHLHRLFDKKRVPSVLLFYGPEGVGKGLFAEEFANALTHKVDIHVYKPEGKNSQHPIAAMRSLVEEAGMPPFQGACKVFIIHDADKMLPSSSNALLKTLEEPHADTHFILTTSRLPEMLPTIVSRCQKMPFFPVSEEEIAKLISDPQIAALSEGSVAKALLLSKKPKSTLVKELLEAKDYSGLAQALSKVEEAEEDEDRMAASDLLFEEILFHIRGQQPERLEKAIPLIKEARQAVYHHIKLKNILENFFLSLAF